MKKIILIISVLIIGFGCGESKNKNKYSVKNDIENQKPKLIRSIEVWNSYGKINYWENVDSVSLAPLGINFVYCDGKILGGWQNSQDISITFDYNN